MLIGLAYGSTSETSTFDLIVLGTGEAGSAAATRCARAGWRVAIIDAEPFGGTCALRGCDPKKVLVGGADVVDWARRMSGRGVGGHAQIDWGELARFKRTFTDPVPAARERAFRAMGIDTYHGAARFVSTDEIAIESTTLRARHFAIATGARPRPLRIPGEELLATSTDFLDLTALPESIAFVGNGYIAFEFAHVGQRAGARTCILGRSAPLTRFDADLVARLVEHTRFLGVDARADAEVVGVSRAVRGFTVTVRSGNGNAELSADLVVHAAGRVPDTSHLALDAAGIASDDDGGIRVTEHLQSVTNARVYAAGDVARVPGSLPLSPVATYEGALVASNLLRGNTRSVALEVVPTVIFTIPPLAMVGLTEAEARGRGLDVRVRAEDTSGWYVNRRVAERCGMYKTLVDRATDRIVGAHILGAHADEMINVVALAMRHGLPATAVRQMMFAYPTGASALPHMFRAGTD